MSEKKRALQISCGAVVMYTLLLVAIGWLMGAWCSHLITKSSASSKEQSASPEAQVMEQLKDLEFGVIDLTLEDGSEKQFACDWTVVKGPYAMDQEAWLMVDGEQGMQTYLRGSYERLAAGSPYYLYRPDASEDGQEVTVYWLMQIGDYYYTAEAWYVDRALSLAKYGDQSGARWHPESFDVEVRVLTGQNSFAEEDAVSVQYDDAHMMDAQRWATWVVLGPEEG